MEIVPAIIAKDFKELQVKIKLVEPYVKSVQIDIMDGIFAPEKSWNNPEDLKNINTNLEIEAHLMVKDVEGEIERWLDSGVKRILAHYEAVVNELRIEQVPRNREKNYESRILTKIEELTNRCKKNGVEFGLVLNLETPIDVLSQFPVPSSQFPIQLMSIAQIGYHGQPFDKKVIPKIRALKEQRPDVKIQVDGGINIENEKQVAEAGADVLIIGSAIFGNENIGKTIETLKGTIKTRGKH